MMKGAPFITSGPKSLPKENSAPPGPEALSQLRKHRPQLTEQHVPDASPGGSPPDPLADEATARESESKEIRALRSGNLFFV